MGLASGGGLLPLPLGHPHRLGQIFDAPPGGATARAPGAHRAELVSAGERPALRGLDLDRERAAGETGSPAADDCGDRGGNRHRCRRDGDCPLRQGDGKTPWHGDHLPGTCRGVVSRALRHFERGQRLRPQGDAVLPLPQPPHPGEPLPLPVGRSYDLPDARSRHLRRRAELAPHPLPAVRADLRRRESLPPRRRYDPRRRPGRRSGERQRGSRVRRRLRRRTGARRQP